MVVEGEKDFKFCGSHRRFNPPERQVLRRLQGEGAQAAGPGRRDGQEVVGHHRQGRGTLKLYNNI